MAEARIPVHLEVTGLIRQVQASGGFASVIAKGERETGSLLVICCARGANARLFERMPDLDGGRKWVLAKEQDPDKPKEFDEYCERRRQQDADCWILELDIDSGERFIGFPGNLVDR